MPTLNIRNLPDEVHSRLRVRAAIRGRSMEAEARDILARSVLEDQELSEAEYRRRVEGVRDHVARYIKSKPGVSVVDELIAERREEARAEERRWDRLTREAQGADDDS